MSAIICQASALRIQIKILAQVLVIPLTLNHRSDVSVRLKKVGFDARFKFKVFGANALSC